jgi:phosphate-selective porin OprO/OprP
MPKRSFFCAACLAIVITALALPVQAGPTVYEKGESWIDVALLVQVEYRYTDPDQGPSTDDIWFRRLRPFVLGGLNKDWQGIIQLDFGAGASGEVYDTTFRWINFQYTGVEQSHLTIGSFKHFFSREFITLGPHLQTIERTFVGNNDYGNPGYTIGIGWDQMTENRKLFYGLSLGAQDHQTPVDTMSFRSPANTDEPEANEGWAAAGRVDFYPLGEMPWDVKPLAGAAVYNRGDFHTQAWRLMLSAGGYYWWNDNDNNTYTVNGVSTRTTNADLDKAWGVELSGGIRGFGLSGDVEYQYLKGELIDAGFTGGLYQNGDTGLDKFTINAGYMIFRNQVEVVGAWSYLNADNYMKASTRSIIGVNWFAYKEGVVRFSANYTFSKNVDGVDGNDGNVVELLGQLNW